jgi:hypothetical protein
MWMFARVVAGFRADRFARAVLRQAPPALALADGSRTTNRVSRGGDEMLMSAHGARTWFRANHRPTNSASRPKAASTADSASDQPAASIAGQSSKP